MARWDDLKLDRRLATPASAVSAKIQRRVGARSEVVAFTMGVRRPGPCPNPDERAPSAILFLPAGVSTSDQDVALQLDALRGVGVERFVKDVGSGSLKHRPQLDECLERLRAGGCGPNPRAAQRQAAGRRVGSQSAPLPERLRTTAAFQLSRPAAGPGWGSA
ncbi:MAG: recombinase family protein [Solirubrobacteraceae bacterium]